MAYTMKIDLTDMPQVYNVSRPVGLNMPNQIDDVMLVQTLMKHAHFTRSTPALGPVESSNSIKVDGIFGPQTLRMLKAFEAHSESMHRFIVSDAIVEPSPPDGFTKSGVLYKIIQLNRAVQEAESSSGTLEWLPFSQETHPVLRASLVKGAVQPKKFKPF